MEGEYNGRVVLHASSVVLSHASFKVSEAGRQRVLKDKQKNVHAGAVGFLEAADIVSERYYVDYHLTGGVDEFPADHGVTYNPYVGGHFTYRDNGSPVLGRGYMVVMDKHMKVHVS
jgi:hypothetical protein